MATETAAPETAGLPPEEGVSASSSSGPPNPKAPPPPVVDVPALTRLLDGRYTEVRQLVRDQLVEHASVLEDQEQMSTADFRDRVRDLVREMAATGQTGLGFPEEYGGGGDIGASVAAFETLALGDLSVLVKSGVQFGLYGGAILQLGTKRHHDAYLRDLITAETMGCFAMTETGHGSNVQALGTVATYDAAAQEFVISSTRPDAWKDYIGNAAAHGQVAVVFAQLEVAGGNEGVHAFVVPIRDGEKVLPGVTIQDDGLKLGLKGVDNGRLWFDGVRVPREALLNRFADVTATGVYESELENPNRRFFTTLGTLVQGRVCVGGAGINASKVAITIAVRYALLRRQFEATSDDEEQLLLDYGQHQRRLFPLLADTYALHFAQEVVAHELHEIFSVAGGDEDSAQDGAGGGEDVDEGEREQARRRLEARAAGTKAYGTWHATRTIQEGREACGGAGYLAVNRFAALKADSDIFTTFEGDNTVLLQLVAKGLLTDYAGEFEDMDQLGMARFAAGLAVDTVLEKTNARKLVERIRDLIPTPDTDDPEAGLLDSEYQLAMLRFREEHMLGGVARRLKSGIDRGMNPGLVFSRVQDHVIGAARAHVEREVLEAFVAKVEGLPDDTDPDLKAALRLLCDLHALVRIESDRAWFMEHDRLTVQRSKAITREINRLCRRIRPIARELVDGLGVPEAVLRAPELIGTVAVGDEPRTAVGRGR